MDVAGKGQERLAHCQLVAGRIVVARQPIAVDDRAAQIIVGVEPVFVGARQRFEQFGGSRGRAAVLHPDRLVGRVVIVAADDAEIDHGAAPLRDLAALHGRNRGSRGGIDRARGAKHQRQRASEPDDQHHGNCPSQPTRPLISAGFYRLSAPCGEYDANFRICLPGRHERRGSRTVHRAGRDQLVSPMPASFSASANLRVSRRGIAGRS